MMKAALISAITAMLVATSVAYSSGDASNTLRSRITKLERQYTALNARVRTNGRIARNADEEVRRVRADHNYLASCIIGGVAVTRYGYQVEYLDIPYTLMALDNTSPGGSIHYYLMAMSPSCVQANSQFKVLRAR